jgi:hypothetical protein
VPFHTSFDPADLGPRERRERLPGAEQERRRGRRWVVGGGTFACPACDLPVAFGGQLSLGVVVGCPYCDRSAPARDYLTLTDEPRPARVRVTATIPAASGLRV